MSSRARRRGPWRRAIFGFILPIIGLVALAYFSYAWAFILMDSLMDYCSPIREELPAGESLSPRTDNLVLVIVDGLRYDTSTEMPFLNELATRGTELTVIGDSPSYSQNAWTTLLTGASPQISGAPTISEGDVDRITPIQADHLFAAATRAGQSTALYGFYWWKEMVPPEFWDAGAFTEGEDAAADQSILLPALAQLETDAPDFMLIHLDQIDYAGHQHGGKSKEYREAALRVDTHLEEIVSRLDLNHQTIVVVSDHGHINDGGHGGGDRVVLTTRLVAAGKGTRAGDHGEIRQIDVAPTLAALMGVPMPVRAEGQFAGELLAWDDETRARDWHALAAQRLALTPAYLSGIGSPIPDVAFEELSGAIGNLLDRGEWKPAYEQAAGMVEILDSRIRSACGERISRDRLERIWMPVAYLVLFGIIIWRNRRRKGYFPLGPALLAIGIYHLLFVLGGNPHSFSSIAGPVSFLMGIAVRMLAGMAIGWVWMVWLRRRQCSRDEVVEETLSYGWLTAAILGIVILVDVWWIGQIVGWTLPGFLGLYILLTTLLQVLFVSAGTLLLAGVSAALNPYTVIARDGSVIRH